MELQVQEMSEEKYMQSLFDAADDSEWGDDDEEEDDSTDFNDDSDCSEDQEI